MLLVLSVLLYINFKSTNKKIFYFFILKYKYVFNCYIVASLLQQILDNSILQFIYIL